MMRALCLSLALCLAVPVLAGEITPADGKKKPPEFLIPCEKCSGCGHLDAIGQGDRNGQILCPVCEAKHGELIVDRADPAYGRVRTRVAVSEREYRLYSCRKILKDAETAIKEMEDRIRPSGGTYSADGLSGAIQAAANRRYELEQSDEYKKWTARRDAAKAELTRLEATIRAEEAVQNAERQVLASSERLASLKGLLERAKAEVGRKDKTVKAPVVEMPKDSFCCPACQGKKGGYAQLKPDDPPAWVLCGTCAGQGVVAMDDLSQFHTPTTGKDKLIHDLDAARKQWEGWAAHAESEAQRLRQASGDNAAVRDRLVDPWMTEAGKAATLARVASCYKDKARECQNKIDVLAGKTSIEVLQCEAAVRTAEITLEADKKKLDEARSKAEKAKEPDPK